MLTKLQSSVTYFKNSDDCIGKITSKSIILQPDSTVFSDEKMRNSGNCIYDHDH